MSSKLVRLADSLVLLAARMRADTGACGGALSAETTAAIGEILAMRAGIAARLRGGDRKADELLHLDNALAELAQAFDAIAKAPSAAPLPRAVRRRRRSDALRLDASARRLLRRGAIMLGLSGVGAIGAMALPAGCTGVSTVVCSGSFVGGLQFAEPTPVDHLTVQLLTAHITPPSGVSGILLDRAGSEGTHHGAGDSGSSGGPGPTIVLNVTDIAHTVFTQGNLAFGVAARSVGGGGGNGGDGVVCPIPCISAGNGGGGGNGGFVTLNNLISVVTQGDNSAGVYALSHGGLGGQGGDSNGGPSSGSGGPGGNSGDVSLRNGGAIVTGGVQANGIYAAAIGGNGGQGGGGFAWASGSSGGVANAGGNVVIANSASGSVVTTGENAVGIYGESIGGFGGSGGGSAGLFGFGGDGSLGGDAKTVQITNAASVTTGGADAYAIFAQSVGGGGGNGGDGAGIVSLGGGSSSGGKGDAVTVINAGTLLTSGDRARGIFAQSIGGGGGNGGDAGGLVSIGGSGSDTSPSGTVMVENSGAIATGGARAFAILAQSIGGGGGDGGSAGGLRTVGGDGGDGGDGGIVIVTNSADLTTIGTDSSAIFAQSVGGGGGNGGSSTSVALFASVAIGGKGAAGGVGKDVSVNAGSTASSTAYDILTLGNNSAGILAQSVGGGGGNGGYAFAGSIGAGFSASLAVGGGGGKGGAAGDVVARTNGTIETFGKDSNGIVAQSIGGGGGNGGFAIALSGSDGAALSFALGGAGGVAGDGHLATVSSWADITTHSDMSIGGLAESIGGGGGSGGFAVSVAAGGGFGGALGWGGKGASGGAGDSASLTSIGDITTSGAFSHGLVAESIGGGGGNGGFAVAGAFTTGVAGLALGFGGKSGAGGSSADATLVSTGTITTSGFGADGLIAQSIGGGGGTGGFAGALGASAGGGAVSLSLGGDGSAGGNASTATLTNTGNVTTHGDEATAIFAQSVGGGGGNGGFALSFAASTQDSFSVAVGGGAGQGGTASTVMLVSTGNVSTDGVDSFGILAQSIGGSGGNGGFAASGSLSTGAVAASVSVGGNGGIGASAGEAHLTSTGNVSTLGDGAIAIFAQSVGGGGGNGGLSGALSLGTATPTPSPSAAAAVTATPPPWPKSSRPATS
ncbi:MAG TPA: hypothetical protein VNU97_14420 [Rhizomicrobium sp.]|nr:hypothetical protein [Rhizomicrobium sp.]